MWLRSSLSRLRIAPNSQLAPDEAGYAAHVKSLSLKLGETLNEPRRQ
jgi:hypothetical protein